MYDRRMLDFAPVLARTTTLAELSAGLTRARLHQLTDGMIDTMRAIVRHARDVDVGFVPEDLAAHDEAGRPDEEHMAWTLGHVIAHTTASAEESAAHAAVLARGVLPEGRSRYEVDWRALTRTAQLVQRLEESRRMRHAYLMAWPERPHLDLFDAKSFLGPINAIATLVLGLWHDDEHLGQLRAIVRQARAARWAQSWMGRRFPAAKPVAPVVPTTSA
jgi:hypothetical protein